MTITEATLLHWNLDESSIRRDFLSHSLSVRLILLASIRSLDRLQSGTIALRKNALTYQPPNAKIEEWRLKVSANFKRDA